MAIEEYRNVSLACVEKNDVNQLPIVNILTKRKFVREMDFYVCPYYGIVFDIKTAKHI